MAEAGSKQGARVERPLSPHLFIYKPPINMMMSITHRITGAALYVGTVLLSWWLIAAAVGPGYFDYVSSWFSWWPGKLVLIGYTWALLQHMLGGIRHFIWDMGKGYDLATIDRLSWGSLILSLLLTAAIWFAATSAHGGA